MSLSCHHRRSQDLWTEITGRDIPAQQIVMFPAIRMGQTQKGCLMSESILTESIKVGGIGKYASMHQHHNRETHISDRRTEEYQAFTVDNLAKNNLTNRTTGLGDEGTGEVFLPKAWCKKLQIAANSPSSTKAFFCCPARK